MNTLPLAQVDQCNKQYQSGDVNNNVPHTPLLQNNRFDMISLKPNQALIH